MTADSAPDRPGPPRAMHLGPALRQAWIGYRRRIDDAMAEAGFADEGFPDGRVLRICSRVAVPTISEVSRELGITRQGGAKAVASLRDRGYVSLEPSETDRREKVVRLTERAERFLATQGRLIRKLENEVEEALGPEVFDVVHRLVELLGGPDQPRLRDYLRARSNWWGD